MISASLSPSTVSAPAVRRGRLGFGLTRRTLLLFLAGALWLVPGFFFPRIVWGMAVWDAILVLAVVLDARRLPAPGQIVAERVWRSAPALANETEVEIRLTQQGSMLLRCTATDDLTEALVQSPPVVNLDLYPSGQSKALYRFTPRERGDHNIGNLYLRYRSANAGLVERWTFADLRQTVRVYPSIRATSEQSLFLTRSKQIELQQRLQRQRGLGRDFESLRDYREGDDLRDICWTATARRGTPVTRQYQTEKSQPVWLLMDAGRLMQARTAQYTRLDYATTTALALSQLALASGDRVGLLAYGNAVQQRVGLGRGAPQLRQLMESLAQVRGEYGEADHLHATVTLNRMQPRRSLVLWITDMAETSMRPEVVDGAMHLMRRHLMLFVAMRQTDLVSLAGQRPEDRRQMFDIAAAQELVHRRALLMAQLRDQGALTIETEPENLTAAVLNRYLDVKEQSLL
jgi:uncharacterized protein (DUF58 family)